MNTAWPGPLAPLDFEFGDLLADVSALGQGAVKAPLVDLRAVRVSGPDAIPFIHAQFTADCRALAPAMHLLTAWCSPKGRVLFAPQIIAGTTAVYLLLPSVQAEAFARRLRMYVLRAAVEVTELGAGYGVLLVASPTATGRPRTFDSSPDAAFASSADGRHHWLLGPHGSLAAIWPDLPAVAVGSNAARLLAIRAGLFALDTATGDAFLPQELSLDISGGVSFEKGCYPGQEIVARVRFRGSVKRRLARLGASGEIPPAPGARLLGADGTPAGTVLNAARSAPRAIEMLAVLDVEATSVRPDGSAIDAVVLAR